MNNRKVQEAVDVLLGRKPVSEDVIPQGEVPFQVTRDVIMALAWHHVQDAEEGISMGSDQVYEFSVKDIKELFDDDMVKEDEELKAYVQEQLDAAEALRPESEGEEEESMETPEEEEEEHETDEEAPEMEEEPEEVE